MDKGELVSDEIVIAMIGGKLDANPQAKGFIFDGFPRTQAQARALDELLEKKKAPISMMVALEVNDEELLHRLLLRGADSGRADDRDENVIRRRIFNYNNQTAPLKKYYSEQKKFHSVYGMGSIEDIFELLVATIDNKTQAKKPYYDGMVTVADISVEDEPAKHLKNNDVKAPKAAAPVKKTVVAKKTIAKPVKKAAPAKKKPVAKKKAAPKKKTVTKKAKPVAKKSVKKVATKKAVKKVVAKKAKAKVVKKAPAKKKVAAKKPIKKSSKKRK
jgi:adenylate kinase